MAVWSSRGRLSISWFITHSADRIKSYSTYANLPSDYPRISLTANHGPQNLRQEDLSNSGENHPQDDTEENRGWSKCNHSSYCNVRHEIGPQITSDASAHARVIASSGLPKAVADLRQAKNVAADSEISFNQIIPGRQPVQQALSREYQKLAGPNSGTSFLSQSQLNYDDLVSQQATIFPERRCSGNSNRVAPQPVSTLYNIGARATDSTFSSPQKVKFLKLTYLLQGSTIPESIKGHYIQYISPRTTLLTRTPTNSTAGTCLSRD